MHAHKKRAVKPVGVFTIIVLLFLLSSNGWARSVTPGTVIRTKTSPAYYYVTETRSLALIPSSDVYQCLNLRKQPHITFDQADVDKLKKIKLLLRNNQEQKTYLIEGTKKRHIVSPAVFEKEGFNKDDILNTVPELLNCIPEGKPLQ